MKKTNTYISVALVILLGLGILKLWITYPGQRSSSLPVLGSVENKQVAFHDEENHPWTLESVKGKVWIVNFMFTRCHGPCPLTNRQMDLIAGEYQSYSNFKLVSITSDPEYDKPDVLKTYSSTFLNYKQDRWAFLSGSLDEIKNLSEKILKLSAPEVPDMHSTRIVLLDQTGKIRGYYDALDGHAMNKLKSDIKKLLSDIT